MRVTKAFLPALRDQGHGSIVTTTSIGGLIAFRFNLVYHATIVEGWKGGARVWRTSWRRSAFA